MTEILLSLNLSIHDAGVIKLYGEIKELRTKWLNGNEKIWGQENEKLWKEIFKEFSVYLSKVILPKLIKENGNTS